MFFNVYTIYKNVIKHMLIAYSGLRAGEREKVHFSKIIPRGEKSLLIGTAHCINICPIRAIWPQA